MYVTQLLKLLKNYRIIFESWTETLRAINLQSGPSLLSTSGKNFNGSMSCLGKKSWWPYSTASALMWLLQQECRSDLLNLSCIHSSLSYIPWYCKQPSNDSSNQSLLYEKTESLNTFYVQVKVEKVAIIHSHSSGICNI